MRNVYFIGTVTAGVAVAIIIVVASMTADPFTNALSGAAAGLVGVVAAFIYRGVRREGS